jgi:hypothetical protein
MGIIKRAAKQLRKGGKGKKLNPKGRRLPSMKKRR